MNVAPEINSLAVSPSPSRHSKSRKNRPPEIAMTKSFRDLLQMALASAARGNPKQAIAVLDTAFNQALASDDKHWISLIGKNVGVICEHEGNLALALAYITEVLERVPQDRLAHYSLGELLHSAGDETASRRAFEERLRLSRKANDDVLLALLSARGLNNK